jgi:hypothetical protein
VSDKHNKCKDCFWWEAEGGVDGKYPQYGICHRNPRPVQTEYKYWCGEWEWPGDKETGVKEHKAGDPDFLACECGHKNCPYPA